MKSYILDLDGRTPIECHNILEWGRLFEDIELRTVQKTQIGDVNVSTVFLVIDHNWSEEGPPILFETMIFGGGDDLNEWQERYATYDQAIAGHKAAVELAKKTIR